MTGTSRRVAPILRGEADWWGFEVRGAITYRLRSNARRQPACFRRMRFNVLAITEPRRPDGVAALPRGCDIPGDYNPPQRARYAFTRGVLRLCAGDLQTAHDSPIFVSFRYPYRVSAPAALYLLANPFRFRTWPFFSWRSDW